MACKVAVDDVGGVGVSVEMNDADVAVAMDVGDRGGSWPGDGVVASERDGDDAASGNLVHAVANVGEALVGIAVRAVGVTGVDNGEVVENLEVKVDVIGARFVGRRPDRTGPERAPGRLVVPMSNGAPTMATSGFHRSRSSRSGTKGCCANVDKPPKT